MSDSASVQNQAEQTIDELKALLREAEAALGSVGEQAGEQVSDLRDRLRGALEQGKTTFNRAAELARQQAARADEVVRSNPYASVGVAAGAGLLVGYLVARSAGRN